MNRPIDHARIAQQKLRACDQRRAASPCTSAARCALSSSTYEPKSTSAARPGRSDGVALGDGLHRVADGVEFVGDFADAVGQVAHDGDAARVVGDRAERIERDDDARHRQHAHHRDGDAVKSARVVAGQDRDGDADHRQRRRPLAGGQAGDDVRGVAGFAGQRDLAHRAKNCVEV